MMTHIDALADKIGPRGSTTEGERRGAAYCCDVFTRLGLNPVLETFTAARSIFFPHLLASILYLACFAIYRLGGQATAWAAAILAALTLASELMELGFMNNPLRLLGPVGQSQNVHAVVQPAGEHRQDLVLIGHIDTQRTPIIFRTPRWVEAYKMFTTVAFILFAVLVVLYLLGALFQWTWVWYASIPSAACAVLLAALCAQADTTPYTAGANDNATAVSMVLSLAETLKSQPLQHTRVYCVCTGCEEVEHSGAEDFFKRYRNEMVNPKGLVFEMLGCAGPGWLTTEGIIIPFKSDPGLRELASTLSQQHPEWGAYPVKITGGNSEMADCVKASVSAITLFGIDRHGVAPYWHQVGDTCDKIKPDVLARSQKMAWAMLQEIDRNN